MNCQRLILEICRFHFVSNTLVTSRTDEEGLAIHICCRRLSIFGHMQQLLEATPALTTLYLAVNSCTGGKPHIWPKWKREQGQP